MAPRQTQRNTLRGPRHGLVTEVECQVVVRPGNQCGRDVAVALAADQYHLGDHSIQVVSINVQPAARSLCADQIECKWSCVTDRRFHRAYILMAKRVSDSQQGLACS